MRLPTRLSRRKPDTHKGDYGHIFILAGSLRFSGAALLCAEAALRSGAGLVTIGLARTLAVPFVRIKPKEVMLLPLAQTRQGAISFAALPQVKRFCETADVVALGPGLSQDRSTQRLIRAVIAGVAKPMVIDADALNALAGHLKLLRGRAAETVLTPHPGEMSRLINRSPEQVQKDRKKVAKFFVHEYNYTIVLKGHRTLVVDRGHEYVNTTGNPGMATAGSGDVLTGMIAAFLGQGLSGFQAAQYAVYLHGRAGDLAAHKKTQISLIASDIIDHIPAAIKASA